MYGFCFKHPGLKNIFDTVLSKNLSKIGGVGAMNDKIKNIFCVSGIGAEVIDGFLTTFLSLKIIGPCAAPEKITRARYEHWLSLMTIFGDRPVGKTNGVGFFDLRW